MQDTEKEALLVKLSTELKSRIEEFYAQYRKPCRFRDLVPSYSARLPKGISTPDFVRYLAERDYAQVLLTPSMRRLVVPGKGYLEANQGPDEIELMDMVFETDERLEQDRIRRRKESRKLSSED